ncbi:putative DNA-binding response regulator in two-component system [Candidatus Kuenenia stuttgartiensis]|jgi:two-component system response regulator GlrR|uniref:Putative DNA-binding response regulator in two-component system n=1 Tax=Kuenenia stuttgartiensis TaxID=174633 RepID=Q1Q500_KUEST|nr:MULTISPECIES: sigma-54 dependent transcriptional regulator [Kuenenia]MBE7547104.1 sigma-54-dependent Fis family transcriptional regulator [Planctomycetia bacterium]MBZ0191079.1 sigma-54 dependent transcriptional regulator [Candidatus Kuenenia stuttgartiensis]MCF6151703.1 sigma-54-dependent Fis family transcriptional regulator [Candidatus Kuenenia stuttgartiensis]MCL4726531.1 sigma-54 dependent transcriptional regulator [Candidatus Kuenenia stuttgartiensis]MCZ7621363.1 sigma-54 dependent tra
MSKEKILIIDDDASILEVLQMRLKALGYSVSIAKDGDEAKTVLFQNKINLVLVDLRLSEENGIELMRDIIKNYPKLPIIIITAHGSIESAVEAMRRGAYSYIAKPFRNDDLAMQIKNALEKQRLTQEIEYLRNQLDERNNFNPIIGKNKQMLEILELVSRVSKTDCNVIIYGESGTGKELIARAIHQNSNRANGPFIATNCGAIPEGLLENELFGHIRGAYTDAHESKEGLFAQADKGSIFLDEISNTSMIFQIKLLRVLQEREIKPVGSTKNRKINVRIIAASNTDLQKAVSEGTFRDDLFYRIHVMPVYLPPLRQRKDDIPLLATYFITEFCKALKKDPLGFSPAALQRMLLYDWPGNIRELRNKIEHAAIVANKNNIEPEDIFPERNTTTNVFHSYKDAKERFEREYIENLLKANNGNITNASKMASRYRADIYKLIKKYNINPEDYKAHVSKL